FLVAHNRLLELSRVQRAQNFGPVSDGGVEILDQHANMGKRSAGHRSLLVRRYGQMIRWVPLALTYPAIGPPILRQGLRPHAGRIFLRGRGTRPRSKATGLPRRLPAIARLPCPFS